MLGKVVQSNARFGLADHLEVHFVHVRMAAGNGRVKTKERSLHVTNAIKMSIVSVKAGINSLAYALIIGMARLNGDLMYQSYRHGYGLKKPVYDLLKVSGVDLSNGGGFRNLQKFQEHFSDYKIIVFDGLNPDRFIFSGNCLSAEIVFTI